MASEEKADKGEYKFDLPDFDEDTFIHREMVSFRTTSILIVWSIVAAAVSLGAFMLVRGNSATGWLLGLVVCGVFGYSLKWLFPKLGADVAHFKRREWSGTAFLFFFSWLAFFIVAVNPPVSDFSPPHVLIAASPTAQVENGTVSLAFLVVDNARVAHQDLTVTRDGQPVPVDLAAPSARDGDMAWYNLTNLAPGAYTVQGMGDDGRGHVARGWANFTVAAAPFEFILPEPAVLASTTQIVARMPDTMPPCDDAHYGRAPCVQRVTLELSDGQQVLMQPPTSDNPGEWVAKSTTRGWRAGVNEFTVSADFLNQYLGSHRIPGGRVTLPDPYQVNVTGSLGNTPVDVRPDLTTRPISVPHLELVALASVLLVGAAVRRRRA